MTSPAHYVRVQKDGLLWHVARVEGDTVHPVQIYRDREQALRSAVGLAGCWEVEVRVEEKQSSDRV